MTGSMEIKILSWNCNGKLHKSITFLNKYSSAYHILHLSETKHNSFTNFNVPVNFICLSNPGSRYGDTDRGGNILLIKKSIYKYLKKTRYFEWGTVLYFSDTILLFLYFVPADSRYYKDESFTEFFTFLNNMNKTGKTVISVGDHNGRFGKINFKNCTHEENVDTTKNTQGNLFTYIYNQCGFYPINHLYSEGRLFAGDFTYIKGERKSQIDFLFTNKHSDIKNFNLEKEGWELSDHKIITFSLYMKLDLPSSALLKWSKDSNKVGHTKIERLFRVNYNINTEKMKRVLSTNLVDFNDRFTTGITKTQEIVENLNDTLQKAFTECKQTNHRNKTPLINKWNTLDGKELWNKINWSGKLSSTKNMDTPDKEDLLKHFKGLYAPIEESPIELTWSNEIYLPVTDDPISEKEISEAFTQQKKGYNYTNNILKPFKDILFPYIYILMNIVFSASTEIIKWAPSKLFTLPKKGNLKLVKNWRGIQVGEYINSWYDRILTNRIKLWMNIDEFQTAYQKGKSCSTQIFTFRTITELAKKKKKAIFISYIDLEKAFDRVKRSTMLQTLSNLGMGITMLKALRNIYSDTTVFLDGIGSFKSTCGIRQGASSSAYIFIIFINGLFKYLRERFTESSIFGKIHNLIHADDTLVLDETFEVLKQKVIYTHEFFNGVDQSVNIGKSKYMCLDNSNKNRITQEMVINGQNVEYTKKEKYLGHYITDDNSLNNSIIYDIEERAANVIVKYRNFINNNKSATIQIRLKVFQACFCSTILNNCEAWGHCLPKQIQTLYNKGLKLALEVRLSTPTALLYLETRQPSVIALIRKRQLKFWLNLKKEIGSDLYNLISRANSTQYISHYRKLELQYNTPQAVYETLNKEFYNDLLKTVKDAKIEQSKLSIYRSIYDIGDTLPCTSLSLTIDNEAQQKIVTKYILSSHNLEAEKGKWLNYDKTCKQCNKGDAETLQHFLFECGSADSIRNKYVFRFDLKSFFAWELCGEVMEKLHKKRTSK